MLLQSVTSDNTALTLRRMRSLVTGDAFGREDYSGSNPAWLSLRPVPLSVHLSLSSLLMQER